ncbi:hypothetical protein [Streptomyces sp. NPDC057682]|uniref:hypothetical protein n=1 Tax=Streptomyces sp. NPDC057682 TaxID=3346210 RepID=UPI0036B25286
MRHIPVFRWVLTVGVLLIACSAALYMAAPGMPELRQIDLTVLDEEPDGSCRVSWTDPFDHTSREGHYRCEADRDPMLKAPNYEEGSDRGWDTGFVVAEGDDKGELYVLGQDDETTDSRLGLSDILVTAGLLLASVGLVGGNLRALPRLRGVDRDLVRRGRHLSRAADALAEDHARAVTAVREAWDRLHRTRLGEELDRIPVARLHHDDGTPFRTDAWERAGLRTVRDVLEGGVWTLGQVPGVGRRTAEHALAAARRTAGRTSGDLLVRISPDRPTPGTTALVVALHVLVNAGPDAREAARTAETLATRLESLLDETAEAAGHRTLLLAGPEQRLRTRAAMAELRVLLDEAEQGTVDRGFGQASADLLRGPDGARDELGAWVDFESRTKEYYRVLEEVTAGVPLPVDPLPLPGTDEDVPGSAVPGP